MNEKTKHDRLIINVVSGKGGTGKTLMSAVLADMLGNEDILTLVVDLDIFVRGLTTLLYFHKHGSLLLVDEGNHSVSDYIITKDYLRLKNIFLGISRYRSFDVIPSVSRVDELLNFRNIIPDSREDAIGLLEKLIKNIPEKYKIVILDSRAGYDEFISATHIVSDISICVQEEDDVSRITSDNLVRQLQSDAKTPLFRVTNKARGIETIKDLDKDLQEGITFLGKLPFDMDVMKSFGSDVFWEIVTRSLYKSALIRVWNRLNKKMKLNIELSDHRISPVVSELLEKQITLLSSRKRIVFIYGIFLAVVGIVGAITGGKILQDLFYDPTRLIYLGIGLSGLLVSLISITNIFRK